MNNFLRMEYITLNNGGENAAGRTWYFSYS